MKNRVIIIVSAIVLNIASIKQARAQYQTSFGIHAGKFASGVDLKHFFDTRGTTGFELLAAYTDEAYGGYLGRAFFVRQISMRMRSQLQIPLKFIVGLGAHSGFYKDRYYAIKDGKVIMYGDNTFSVGMDAMIGLEFNTRKVPFTLGIDATPFYTFINPGPEWIDFGVNLRYIIR